MKATIEEKRLLVMEKIMQEFMPENMTAETKAKETHNTLLLVTMLTKVFFFRKPAKFFPELGIYEGNGNSFSCTLERRKSFEVNFET